MMEYVPYHPTGTLAPFVNQMFYLNNYQPEHTMERLVPDGSTNLIIELDDRVRYIFDNETKEPLQECRGAWFSGMHTGYISFSTPTTELFAIRFLPGGCFPLVKIPLNQFNDQVVDATKIFGESILQLREKLLEKGPAEQKITTVANWLEEHIDLSLVAPTTISQAIHTLSEQATLTNVQAVIANSGYSQKHFIHLFKKYVGLSPKVFQRIRRFSEVFPLILEEKHINWAQLSADCGYYDQAHFIKDFKHFSGYNPKGFLDEDHDRQNFFPLED